MGSVGSRSAVVVAAILVAACAAISQQKAQAPRADNAEFHNLKVLPRNITHDELIATMRSFARSLGTRCEHCHVQNPAGSKEQFDFASDAKPEKNIARTMVLMTRDINHNYMTKVPVDHDEPAANVSCWTCHRGHVHPESALPPEPPRNAPAPTPQP